jgi:integrase
MAKVAKRRGRYVLDFYDHQGMRRWVTLPKGTTKKKANGKLREIEDQIAKGVYIPDRRIPTFKQAAKAWLELKKHNVRQSSWEMYEGHLKNHFQTINPIKLNRITTGTVEKFISEKQKDEMNITTLRKLIVTFNQVMSYGVRHRYIDYNPVRDAERPKRKRAKHNGLDDSAIQVLAPADINALLGTVTNCKYKTLFTLAIFSGARQGELLGLKWSDVDWENNQIHIQRTYNKKTWYEPKSKTSYRRIDLGPEVIRVLKKWKLECPPNDHDLIFPSKYNQPLNESCMVRKYFKPSLKSAELPMIRFHDLRHTYASLMIEQGENIKYIQSQLGHSSPTVTLNVYAHLLKDVNGEAACRLENAVFQTTGGSMVASDKKGATLRSITP